MIFIPHYVTKVIDGRRELNGNNVAIMCAYVCLCFSDKD